MGQHELIKALEEETRRETERLMKEADAEAEAIVREAEQGAEKERQERLGAVKKELENERTVAINRASAGARGHLLAERRQIIEDVFREAVKKFGGLPKREYGDLVKALYRELKTEWNKEMVTKGNRPSVLINPSDLGVIKDPEVEFVPDEAVSHGVVFVSRNGKLRAENCFSSRLKKGRAEIVPGLKKILFD
jgi:V/A-type H+-transporting ATPase subunit E